MDARQIVTPVYLLDWLNAQLHCDDLYRHCAVTRAAQVDHEDGSHTFEAGVEFKLIPRDMLTQQLNARINALLETAENLYRLK